MTDATPSDASCPADPELVAFLAGAAAPERARQIGMHLATCQDCRQWMAGMRVEGDNRGQALKRLRLWIWVATALGVGSILLLVLVVIAGQKMERLASEQRDGVVPGGAIFRILPQRQVEPGNVFPSFRRNETLTFERVIPATSFSRLYSLEAGAGLQGVAFKEDGVLPAPSKRGVYFYLAIDFPQESSAQSIAEFEKSLDDAVRKSQPMVLLGNLNASLAQRGWKHQIFPLEWED